MRNIFIIIAIVVLAAVAGIGYYRADLLSNIFAAPKKEPVTSAKTLEYRNASFGVSFSYPNTYDLQERDLTYNGDPVHIVTLIPKGISVPVNGEGGTAITLSIFTQKTPLPLSDWLRTMSNESPTPGGGFDYQETAVAGQSALAYTATGLYESDNVAILKGTHVFVFSSTWMTREDAILKDFSSLLETVTFSN